MHMSSFDPKDDPSDPSSPDDVQDRDQTISGAQCAAARALLGWSKGRLADLADVPPASVRALEDGSDDLPRTALLALRMVFETAGLVFTAGGRGELGVRLRRPADVAGRSKGVTLH